MRASIRFLIFTVVALAMATPITPALGQISLKTVADLDTTKTAPAFESIPTRVRVNLSPIAPEPGDELDVMIGDGDLPWEDEDRLPQDFRIWGRYNRVEGIALHSVLERRLSRRGFSPAFTAELGYAFAAERGQYSLRVEQPVAPLHKATVGVAAYRKFLPFFYQDEAISSEENSASAFFLHRDYWDWYEAEGFRAFVGIYPSPFLSLTGGIVRQDERSLVNHTDWSLFRQTDDFVTNPPIVEGEFRAFEAAAVFDSRPRSHNGDVHNRSSWGAVEHLLRLSWERAGAGLGGDFGLWRVSADLRNYFRVSARQSLATRILIGTGHSDPGLPPQRRFALGGLGTLRGHNYRDLRGDNLALVNLEYGFDLGGKNRILVFVDSGMAWDEGNLTKQRIPIDVGTGLRLGQDGLTLLIAQTVNESNADAKLYVRLKESF